MSAHLAPIMEGAEVMTRPVTFTLCTGERVACNPSSLESLDAAEAAICEAARRMGVDGRIMFTVARRQLGDIAATRAAHPAPDLEAARAAVASATRALDEAETAEECDAAEAALTAALDRRDAALDAFELRYHAAELRRIQGLPGERLFWLDGEAYRLASQPPADDGTPLWTLNNAATGEIVNGYAGDRANVAAFLEWSGFYLETTRDAWKRGERLQRIQHAINPDATPRRERRPMDEVTRFVFTEADSETGARVVCDIMEFSAPAAEAVQLLRTWRRTDLAAARVRIERGFICDDGAAFFPWPGGSFSPWRP